MSESRLTAFVVVAEDASDGSVPDWALLNHASIAS